MSKPKVYSEPQVEPEAPAEEPQRPVQEFRLVPVCHLGVQPYNRL
jgi:hypothetical protein